MSQDSLLDLLKELLATPNGQMRLLGSILCIGPAWHSYNKGTPVETFDYVVMGTGTLFVFTSAIMAVIAEIKKPPARKKNARKTDK